MRLRKWFRRRATLIATLDRLNATLYFQRGEIAALKYKLEHIEKFNVSLKKALSETEAELKQARETWALEKDTILRAVVGAAQGIIDRMPRA